MAFKELCKKGNSEFYTLLVTNPAQRDGVMCKELISRRGACFWAACPRVTHAALPGASYLCLYSVGMNGELWPTDCGKSDFYDLSGLFFFLLVSVACSVLTFQRCPQWSAISLLQGKRWEENSGPKFLRPPVQLICYSSR